MVKFATCDRISRDRRLTFAQRNENISRLLGTNFSGKMWLRHGAGGGIEATG
jgi:hypothetical protein